jgi:hypothetical protein
MLVMPCPAELRVKPMAQQQTSQEMKQRCTSFPMVNAVVGGKNGEVVEYLNLITVTRICYCT